MADRDWVGRLASVCMFVCLCVCPGASAGQEKVEFRETDTTKAFRKPRSTFSTEEVGANSLILEGRILGREVKFSETARQ